jgi:hypothetical protein
MYQNLKGGGAKLRPASAGVSKLDASNFEYSVSNFTGLIYVGCIQVCDSVIGLSFLITA